MVVRRGAVRAADGSGVVEVKRGAGVLLDVVGVGLVRAWGGEVGVLAVWLVWLVWLGGVLWSVVLHEMVVRRGEVRAVDGSGVVEVMRGVSVLLGVMGMGLVRVWRGGVGVVAVWLVWLV
jgi:hypothetical protein